MEVSAENSGSLKNLGRNLDYNDELFDDIIGDDDDDGQELDYDGKVEGDLEETKKKKVRKETAEERKARRLRKLAEDQAEYRQWVRRRKEEKRRRKEGKVKAKGEDLKTKSNEKKLQPRDFELWKDLLSLDEDDI